MADAKVKSLLDRLAEGVAVKEKLPNYKSPMSYAIFIYRRVAQPIKQNYLVKVQDKLLSCGFESHLSFIKTIAYGRNVVSKGTKRNIGSVL